MSGENCENSTDREFEDYFRKEQPADLIPRLENVLERLDGHDEQELEVAGEIVNYVITQLEAMDEDTAGDSVQSDYTETGDSVQRENTELEPAAYLIGEPGYAGLFFNEEHFVREKMYESLDEAREAAAKHEDFDFEPLVRLSNARQAVHHIIDEAQHHAKQNDSWSFQTHQIVEWLQEQINEEFTQKGESGGK